MDSSPYESEGRQVDKQLVMKAKGQSAVQLDDTSDEEASLFEIHDSEEDFEAVAPEVCSVMLEPRAPIVHVDGRLRDGIFQSYRGDGGQSDLVFESMERFSDNDYANGDNADSIGLLVKEDHKHDHIGTKAFEISFSLEVPLEAHGLTPEEKRNICDRQEDLMLCDGLKRREGLVETAKTNADFVFRIPTTKMCLQARSVGVSPLSLELDESEPGGKAVMPGDENEESREAICSIPVHPCLRDTDSKQMGIKEGFNRSCVSVAELDGFHRSCVSVAELGDGSTEASEEVMPTEDTLKVHVDPIVDNESFPLSQEDEVKLLTGDLIRPSAGGAEKVSAHRKKNKNLEFFVRESFVSSGVQPERSSGAPIGEKIFAFKQFGGHMRITRSMSHGKHQPSRIDNTQVGICRFGIPVGKRTGKRSAARGAQSLWGTGMGLISLSGGSDVQPLLPLQEGHAVKGSYGHVSIGLAWTQCNGKGKLKSQVSGELRPHQEHDCQDMTNDSMAERKTTSPTKGTNDLQLSHGSMSYKAIARPPKKCFKKMPSFANGESQPESKAGKRGKRTSKTVSKKGQKDAPTRRGRGVLAGDVPSSFFQCKVTSRGATIGGDSIEFPEIEGLGSQMCRDIVGFQKISEKTSHFQSYLQEGSLIGSQSRRTHIDGTNGMGSLAGDECMEEFDIKVGMQVEEMGTSQELIPQEESETIIDVESCGSADKRQVNEEEVLLRRVEKSRSRNLEKSSGSVLNGSELLSSTQFVTEQAGQDSPKGFETNNDVLTGKGGDLFPIGGLVEPDRNPLETNRLMGSSCQSNYTKLPQSKHLENMNKESIQRILGEQRRKCAHFGEDAGSATTYGVHAKVGNDFVQYPEIKSQMRGRGSKKGKASGKKVFASKCELKSQNCAQDSSDMGKKEQSRQGKTSLKRSESSQGAVILQLRYEPKRTAAKNLKVQNKVVTREAYAENSQKDQQVSMEICGRDSEKVGFQMEHKLQRKCKRQSKGIKIMGAAGTCDLDSKAVMKRKNILDTEKTLSGVLKRDQLGCRKKKATETPKLLASSCVNKETDVTSTLVDKQLKVLKAIKNGKGKPSSRLETKVVEKDTYNLKTNDVASADIGCSERLVADSSTFVLHVEKQNIERTTTLEESKPDEVPHILCESVLVETERSCFTDMGDADSPVVAKKADEEENFGNVSSIGLEQSVDLITELEKAPDHSLATGGFSVTTIGEDMSSEGTGGELPDQGINLSTNVAQNTSAKGGSAGVGWVMCDDCRKWRCISTELADIIEATDARWTCSDNPNKTFADCSVPQEKSSAQINAELDLSDDTVDGDDEDIDAAANSKKLEGFRGSRPITWILTRHNIFLHRRRKTHDNDDSVICHCKPPEEGTQGCGDSCINRMVSVECMPEICACGEACSNQQFRKRMSADVALFRCGKKGFGLKVLENVPKGTFITEYVGEVVDMPTFEARQKEYAGTGQKHFYFMTLNSNEVIDAYAKGNLGRFINHSCEPNCQTEKWWVNGEICIGLFAIRDLVQGEEITFDYHYEPVYGAAPKKCYCGSSYCRGYIGGQPLDPNSIAESDSDDEEDPEPVMLQASEDEESNFEDKALVPTKKFRQGPEAASWEPKMARSGRLKRKRFSGTKADEHDNGLKSSSQSKRLKGSTYCGKNPFSKRPFLEVNMGWQDLGRSSRSIQPSEVERKLNALLDAHGGLVKRKDMAKDYLRLIVLSSASGEAIQGGPSWSVRDLSLLLDAVLKTSSRSVLSDILHKNGLQMLHNLVKQSRRNWKKIPILRKLMKVLELLSTRKVLTKRHISCIPSRPGMESFVDSIFELTRHDDTEVQQIARRFKSEWFPAGAAFFQHSYRGKASKTQPWCLLQKPMSHQEFLAGNSSFLPLSNSSGLQKLSSKSSQQSRSLSKPSGSFVQTKRASSFDIPQSSNRMLANSTCVVEGIDKTFENKLSCSLDSPKNAKLESLDGEPKRRKRVSRWDTPASQSDNAYHDYRLSLGADNGLGLGQETCIIQNAHQSFPPSQSSETQVDSCGQPFQEPAVHVQPESSCCLSDSQFTKLDLSQSVVPDRRDSPSNQQVAEKPPCLFKHSAYPPRAQMLSKYCSLQPGLWKIQAGAPRTQSFRGRMTPQECYPPPMPVCPSQSSQQVRMPSMPPHENPFLASQCGQSIAQNPVLTSSLPVPVPLQYGPMQMPGRPSSASHFIPPRVECRMPQKTPRPGQLPYAGAVFQPVRPVTSPAFTPHFKSQGGFQKLQGSSGGVRPHSACRPVQVPESFRCQGPLSVSQNKLAMGDPGPLAVGGCRPFTSDHRDKEANVCVGSMGEYEPEPPVPGL